MALTKAEQRIVGEIEDILRIGGYDWRIVEELYEPAARAPQLQRIKLDFIRMNVIGDYVFADELLTAVIVAYFFPVRKFPKRWKDKRIRTFVHFVMERLFMLQKLALVKQIRKFDRAMARTLERLDALRNAMAHSFTPEMRREYRETKRVTWEGRGHIHDGGDRTVRCGYAETDRLPRRDGVRQGGSEARSRTP